MGNCLKNPRTVLDPMLMTDETSHVAIGQNQPLTTSPEVWTAEIPMTEGQLRGKRDTFWETAPVYDGRKEIWDALKAACEAFEEGEHELAQAILEGASISLPTGRLVEAYDELGNRYVVPKYCISKPTNMVMGDAGGSAPNSPRQHQGNAVSIEDEDAQEPTSTTQLLQEHSPPSPASSGGGGGGVLRHRGFASRAGKKTKSKGKKSETAESLSSGNSATRTTVPSGDPMVVKVRLSTHPKDIKMTLQASDRVRDMKKRLEEDHDVTASRITVLYSGRVLNDNAYVKTLEIPKGFILQAIVT